ncbi:MAG: urea transport system permease protein [Actinomycetota bacterium]|jgi:branched-subunit amino acid ABC-type transport system permease component|nr:urea transport system permease protein [Actinomycetota bacterium]
MVGLLLDCLTTSALLFLVTVGLLIIFGMMRIINFAHGAFITVGAYSSVVAGQYGLSPWLTLILGPLAAGAIGAIAEPLVLRRLYGRQLDTILATWGLALIITQLVTLKFGRGTQPVDSIDLGTVTVLGTPYSSYRLAVIPLVLVLSIAILLILRRTRYGLVGRAVIMDDDLAQTLGVNVKRVRFTSFVLGSAIAGLAGAVLVPMSSVDPNLGLPWLINAFLISLLVGVSTTALAFASLALGSAQVLVGLSFNSVSATLAIPVLAVVLLRLRAHGFVRG